MTATRPPDTVTRTLVLHIPDLTANSFMGSGCCVLSAADAIRQELETWPSVASAEGDGNRGVVTVNLISLETELAPILEVLESMGYPASTLA